MSLSETSDPCESRHLDEIRAKIFYLASDVEPASPPAAMLLRAVAESIAEAPEVAENYNGRNGHSAAKTDVTRAFPFPRVSEIHAQVSRARR